MREDIKEMEMLAKARKWTIVVIVIAVLMYFESWLLVDLWLWFAVPLGAKVLSFYQIMGLNILIHSFISRLRYAKKEDDENILMKNFFSAVASMPLRWGVGWLIAHFALGLV